MFIPMKLAHPVLIFERVGRGFSYLRFSNVRRMLGLS